MLSVINTARPVPNASALDPNTRVIRRGKGRQKVRWLEDVALPRVKLEKGKGEGIKKDLRSV